MKYNRRNMRNDLIPQMDMMDFYNYLEFLNLGGLVKASTGTEDIPTTFNFTPWNQKTTGYDDLTLDGEDFNPYDEGEFTTSKIERDRKNFCPPMSEQSPWDWENTHKPYLLCNPKLRNLLRRLMV